VLYSYQALLLHVMLEEDLKIKYMALWLSAETFEFVKLSLCLAKYHAMMTSLT